MPVPALAVRHLWRGALLDVVHATEGAEPLTLSGEVAWQWSLAGIDLGFVPAAWRPALLLSPPLLSQVRQVPRGTFLVPDALLDGEGTRELWRFDSGGTPELVTDARWSLRVVGADGLEVDHDVLRAAGRLRESLGERTLELAPQERVVLGVGDHVFETQVVPLPASVGREPVSRAHLVLGAAVVALLFAAQVALKELVPPQSTLANTDLEEVLARLTPPTPPPRVQAPPPPVPEPPRAVRHGGGPVGPAGRAGRRDGRVPEAARQAQAAMAVVQDSPLLSLMRGELAADLGAGFTGTLEESAGHLRGVAGVQLGVGGLAGRGDFTGGGNTVHGAGFGPGGGRGPGVADGTEHEGGDFGPRSVGTEPVTDIRAVVSVGALPKELIDREIKRHLSRIRYCYQRELQRAPGLAGRVRVKFTISGSGAVSRAVAETQGLPATVGHCVEDQFHKMVFPEPRGGGIVLVKYPFTFAPM